MHELRAPLPVSDKELFEMRSDILLAVNDFVKRQASNATPIINSRFWDLVAQSGHNNAAAFYVAHKPNINIEFALTTKVLLDALKEKADFEEIAPPAEEQPHELYLLEEALKRTEEYFGFYYPKAVDLLQRQAETDPNTAGINATLDILDAQQEDRTFKFATIDEYNLTLNVINRRIYDACQDLIEVASYEALVCVGFGNQAYGDSDKMNSAFAKLPISPQIPDSLVLRTELLALQDVLNFFIPFRDKTELEIKENRALAVLDTKLAFSNLTDDEIFDLFDDIQAANVVFQERHSKKHKEHDKLIEPIQQAFMESTSASPSDRDADATMLYKDTEQELTIKFGQQLFALHSNLAERMATVRQLGMLDQKAIFLKFRTVAQAADQASDYIGSVEDVVPNKNRLTPLYALHNNTTRVTYDAMKTNPPARGADVSTFVYRLGKNNDTVKQAHKDLIVTGLRMALNGIGYHGNYSNAFTRRAYAKNVLAPLCNRLQTLKDGMEKSAINAVGEPLKPQ